MIPPLATARTTAREVQLAGVPSPTQRSGSEVSTARASFGTGTGSPGSAYDGASGTMRTSVRRSPEIRHGTDLVRVRSHAAWDCTVH